MTWIRLEDDFYDHPKFLGAGPAGAYLMLVSIAWSSHHQTDGFVPHECVKRIAHFKGGQGGVQRAIDVGLWEPVEGGYRIHDYHDYQRSREQIAAVSAQRSAAAKHRWVQTG